MIRSLAVVLASAVLATPLFASPIKETVHVVIANGPNAGTYDGQTDRGGCSAGLTGPGSFGNQFSLPKEKDLCQPEHRLHKTENIVDTFFWVLRPAESSAFGS